MSSTNNIDNYPSWDSEIHKKLKLKRYEQDLNERLVNSELNKDLTDDYNNRYFPDKLQGRPTLNTLLEERKLYEKLNTETKLHGIYNRHNEPIKAFAYENKNEIALKEAKENLLMGHKDEESKLLEQQFKEAEKAFKLKNEQDRLEELAEEKLPPLELARLTTQTSPTHTALSSIATTHAQSSMFPENEEIEHEHTKQLKESIKERKKEALTKTDIEEILTKEVEKNDNKPLKIKEYEFFLNEKGKPKIRNIEANRIQNEAHIYKTFYKEYIEEKAKSLGIEPKLMHEHLAKGFSPKKRKMKNSPINKLKARFLILKGEIENGQDNIEVINELKRISKELYDKGHLDTYIH